MLFLLQFLGSLAGQAVQKEWAWEAWKALCNLFDRMQKTPTSPSPAVSLD